MAKDNVKRRSDKKPLTWRGWINIFRRTFWQWHKHDPALVAAGLSYFTLFSLPPAAYLTVRFVGHVFGYDPARDLVFRRIGDLTSPDMAASVQNIIQGGRDPGGSITILSFILLLWGGARVFTHLQRAFDFIWHVETPTSIEVGRLLRARKYAFDRFRALMMVVFVGIVLFASFAVDLVLAAIGDTLSASVPGAAQIRSWPFTTVMTSFPLFAFAFALLFKWLPNTVISWREAAVGAAFTAALFTFGRSLITLYFRFTEFASLAGAAGSAVVVLLWVFFAMQLLLLGAEFTWVYAQEMTEPGRIRRRRA